MIDLDKSNMNEIANVDVDEFKEIYNEQFRIGKPIFEYHSSEVELKHLSQIHCRGSSHKNMHDLDENLIVFFLHEDTLYCWNGEKNVK